MNRACSGTFTDVDRATKAGEVVGVRPPRVLMVLDGPYPTARGGGAEAQVRTLTGAMRKRGQRVTIVVPLNADGPQSRVSRVDGVPVCRLRYPRLRLLGGPLLWLALTAFLVGRRKHHDVWHVHGARSWAVVCAMLGRAIGKRVVIKVPSTWDLEHGVLCPGAGGLGNLPYRCLSRADGWQAISQRIATSLRSRGLPPSRIAAIPNAVDTHRFGGISRAPSASARFVFIGRLVEEKDLFTLLDAFSDIAARHAGAHLMIIGTGPLHESLEFRAATLAIESAVTFAGHREDIDQVLAHANIGVLPSRFEGLSNALLECMAAGLPMVASRVSGNEDFVRHAENGWLFEPGDRSGLAECLDAAAALAPAQRHAMGERARETVTSKAGIDAVLASLAALYSGDANALPAAASPRRA